MKPSRLKVEQCEGKWNKMYLAVLSTCDKVFDADLVNDIGISLK